MKKRLLLIIMSLLIFSALVINSGVLALDYAVEKELPDLYKNAYMISVKRNNNTFDIDFDTKNLKANADAHAPTIYNHQFLVMPVTRGDRYFYLVPLYEGGVLDIESGGNIYMYNKYPHGRNNQIFYLSGETADGYYVISSPWATGAFDMSVSSLDRDPFEHPSSCGGNIYYNSTVHWGTNQLFKFTKGMAIKSPVPQPISYAKEFNIELPPMVDYYSAPYDTSNTAELIGKAVIPFIYIQDPMLIRSRQVIESPYYTLTRKQYWQRIWWYDKPAGVTMEYTVTSQVGVQSFSSTTFEQMTSTKFSVNSEIGVTVAGISTKLGTLLSKETQNKMVYTDSVTITQTDTESTKITLAGDKRINYALYQLVDAYTLQRLDGSKVTEWTIHPKGHRVGVYYDGTLRYEKESNNIPDLANGPVLSNILVSGQTETTDPLKDWFYFDLAQIKDIGVHLNGDYKYIQFFHQSNRSTPMAFFTQSTPGTGDYVFRPTLTGRYYIGISGYVGKYSFLINY